MLKLKFMPGLICRDCLSQLNVNRPRRSCCTKERIWSACNNAVPWSQTRLWLSASGFSGCCPIEISYLFAWPFLRFFFGEWKWYMAHDSGSVHARVDSTPLDFQPTPSRPQSHMHKIIIKRHLCGPRRRHGEKGAAAIKGPLEPKPKSIDMFCNHWKKFTIMFTPKFCHCISWNGYMFWKMWNKMWQL